MLHDSFYFGKQGKCFKLIKENFNLIKEEYLSQKNKTFLTQHDFSDGADTYVEGNWKALGICTANREYQSDKDYPVLLNILREFPYKMHVAFMEVKANTSIGKHIDKEGGWRYQLTIDDGGGDKSGIYYEDLDTKEEKLHIFKTGNEIVLQPGLQLHNGFNKNSNTRITLLLDFFKESMYNIDKYNSYYKNYDEQYEGLDALGDLYESKKHAD